MTGLTAFVAAMLGATPVTSAAPAGYGDGGPKSSLQRHSAATGTSGRAANDDALDQLFYHGGAHEPRNGTCAYPNYYGIYPNYYVGADGRGHFCNSWTPSNLSR